MFALLPCISFIFIFIYIHKKNRITNKNPSIRKAFLLASTICGLLVVLSTELLSLFWALTFSSLLFFWIFVSVVTCTLLFRLPNPNTPFFTHKFSDFKLSDKIFIAIIVFIVFIIGLIAFTAPPNTYDSMTYHMARIPHWIQNKTVAHYPTNHMRQLYTQPGAEFSILHLQILNNGDRFANFIQWFSMIGCIIGISLIAKLLGASLSGQIYASVFTATIPMGVLQGSSTQNDYAASFWLISFICFALLRIKDKNNFYLLLSAAISLGLGCITKGTTYIYSLPFIVYLITSEIQTHKIKAFISILLLLLIPAAINTGYYYRNYDLGKSIFAPFYQTKQMSNEEMSPPLFISNTIKNLALHVGTKSDETNKAIYKTIENFHNTINIDLTDSRISYLDMKFVLPRVNRSEDQAGNPFHLYLGLLCFGFVLLSKELRYNKNMLLYILCASFSFFLFIAITKWQPWHSRFHLTLFIIFSAFTGIAISKSPKFVAVILCSLFLGNAMPYVFKNNSRRIISKKPTIFNTPRIDQYFSNYPSRAPAYKKAVEIIKSSGCNNIGLISHGECWEYPIWALLKENNNFDFRLEQVQPLNKSKKYLDKFNLTSFKPCLLVGLTGPTIPNKYTTNNSSYIKTWGFDPVSIFQRDTGTLAKSNLLTHFNNIVKLVFTSTTKINEDKDNTLFKQRNMQILNFFRNELNEANLVDTEELNKVYPKAGDDFKNILITGLQLRASGYMRGNKQHFDAGQKLAAQWLTWFMKNKDKVQSAFDNM